MTDFYKVLKADPLGEPWTPNVANAKPIQNYWCQVEGMEQPVSIGRQADNPLHPGTHVYGDLMFAKSQKGTQYWKFKSAKVPEDVQRPQDDPHTPAQAAAQTATKPDVSSAVPGWFQPYGNMIEYIYKQMKDVDPASAGEPEPIEPQKLEPLDEATQATIDELFGV